MKKFLSLMVCAALLLPLAATAQQTFEFDLTASQPAYSDATGYGYDLGTGALSKKDLHPTFFSVKVPDGNYKVTVTVGSKSYAGVTVLRAETRRLFEEKVVTRKGEFKTFTFNVHVHSTEIDGNTRVGISMRERVDVGWDNKLTLEFNGDAPAVKSIRIEPADDDVVTVWLCGDSTVVDQDADPYTSWGQILPRFFTEKVVVANLANSGLTTTSFYNQNRLAKILHSLKPGDYVVVEFGHNDEKDRGAGSGAWYNYTYNLKRYIDEIRQKGGIPILVSPTERRNFVDGDISPTHGDYPAAMKATADREKVAFYDLTSMTRVLYETFGEEGSKCLLVHYPAGTYPNQPAALADNTHFSPFGAYEICKMVVMGLKYLDLNLVKYLRSDWVDFDAADPDDPAAFYWPYTPSLATLERPAGS